MDPGDVAPIAPPPLIHHHHHHRRRSWWTRMRQKQRQWSWYPLWLLAAAGLTWGIISLIENAHFRTDTGN